MSSRRSSTTGSTASTTAPRPRAWSTTRSWPSPATVPSPHVATRLPGSATSTVQPGRRGGPAETGVVLQVDHGGVRVTPRGDDVVDRDVEVVGRAEHDHQRPSSGACSAPVAPLSVVSQYRPENGAVTPAWTPPSCSAKEPRVRTSCFFRAMRWGIACCEARSTCGVSPSPGGGGGAAVAGVAAARDAAASWQRRRPRGRSSSWRCSHPTRRSKRPHGCPDLLRGC